MSSIAGNKEEVAARAVHAEMSFSDKDSRTESELTGLSIPDTNSNTNSK